MIRHIVNIEYQLNMNIMKMVLLRRRMEDKEDKTEAEVAVAVVLQ